MGLSRWQKSNVPNLVIKYGHDKSISKVSVCLSVSYNCRARLPFSNLVAKKMLYPWGNNVLILSERTIFSDRRGGRKIGIVSLKPVRLLVASHITGNGMCACASLCHDQMVPLKLHWKVRDPCRKLVSAEAQTTHTRIQPQRRGKAGGREEAQTLPEEAKHVLH